MNLTNVLLTLTVLLTAVALTGAQSPPSGPQPDKPTVRGYNGSFATQSYPGGVQQVAQ